MLYLLKGETLLPFLSKTRVAVLAVSFSATLDSTKLTLQTSLLDARELYNYRPSSGYI